ncbi:MULTISPECIES: VOC family protein [unclassified Streptomyces]|uniref:VOC family protein n=1 Tax=unclassified Streptomyces TaxID=2593676 RepID=UPI00093C086E|nr:VOC family protein [Streptomyces sp. CB02009]OKJ49502.1 dioxygenase [Streptomyces sp. CB02009]
MGLHRLAHLTIGVPQVDATVAYYTDFGLTPLGDGRFATADGGEQLRIVHAAHRRLEGMVVSADDTDDLRRIRAALVRLGMPCDYSELSLRAVDPGTRVTVTVEVQPRVSQPVPADTLYNRPGAAPRIDARSAAVLRESPVRPRRLGHVVLGSTDQETSQRFFTEGLGFRASDLVPGAAFLRCSTDHHNVLVQRAPVPFLHHTSWQVDDVDEVGRGATRMLEGHPERHVWGLGRHYLGSNFFWYLKDPAGNFSEYFADMDCVVDDQLWTPRVWEDIRALYSWGPPVPASFLAPEDLAELMTGSHEAG